jgi:hypothetical protein
VRCTRLFSNKQKASSGTPRKVRLQFSVYAPRIIHPRVSAVKKRGRYSSFLLRYKNEIKAPLVIFVSKEMVSIFMTLMV